MLWKVEKRQTFFSLLLLDSNPRFKTSSKSIIHTAALHIVGSCGEFVVSTHENRFGFRKGEAGASSEWPQRLEVYSRQVIKVSCLILKPNRKYKNHSISVHVIFSYLIHDIKHLCAFVEKKKHLLLRRLSWSLDFLHKKKVCCWLQVLRTAILLHKNEFVTQILPKSLNW